jgi:hypothetical protein
MRDKTKPLRTKARVETGAAAGPEAVSQGEPAEPVLGQRRRPETGRFCLQVDRQTKSSYETYEAAEQAALNIKKAHSVVRVVIYDTVEGVDKVIELP